MATLAHWMELALHAARQNLEIGEVPVGAVLVFEERAIAIAANQVKNRQDPLAHAEILAVKTSQLSLSDWSKTTLYVTLEPCPMCMGAILQRRIGKLVFGAYNLKWGACGTVIDMIGPFPLAACEVIGGICEAESTALLQQFFEDLRTEGESEATTPNRRSDKDMKGSL